jgi:hypothetical protein
MTKNKATKAAPRINAKLSALIATASTVGFLASGAFEDAVQLVRDAVKALPKGASPLKHQAMIDLGLAYKSGYIARRLSGEPLFVKRWGNYSDEQKMAEALAIYAKPGFESGKPNRRTELEHAACRSADTSYSKARVRAGVITERKGAGGRKPRPASNVKEPARDLLAVSPKFDNDNEARDYFRSAFAALLTTTEVNRQTGRKKEVKHIAFVVQSIIQDAKAAIEKALA